MTAGVEAFAEAQMLDAVTRRRLAIVVEELVANLIDHAAHRRDIVFSLTLDAGLQGPAVVLEDDSDAFDPRGVAPVDAPNPVRGGGVGLALVAAWCDFVSYETNHGRNRLALRLRSPG